MNVIRYAHRLMHTSELHQ